MYTLSRFMLIASVVLLGYSFVSACLIIGWIGWLILVLFFLNWFRRRGRPPTTLGSGRFATEMEMRNARMVGGTGLVLGWLPRKGFRDRIAMVMSNAPAKVICRSFFGCREFVTLPASSHHASIFCPTGGGKNVSLISMWLLTVNESAVVVDFKAENARLFAKARRRMGQRVVILDPFKICTDLPDTYNPLDWIGKDSSRAIDDCKAIAKALVVRPEGADKSEFFYQRAENQLSAVTAATVYHGIREKGSRDLLYVATICSNKDAVDAVGARMLAEPEIWGGSLSRMGGQMLAGAKEERASVGGTVTISIDFMNSPDVADSLRTSSFDPRDLYRRRMTIFLVLPPEYMRSHSALIRMWISSFVGVVIRGGLNKQRHTHFIIDEAGSVGALDCISDVLTIGRGYGARLQLYYQDMSQLNRCWPHGGGQGLLANTTCIAFSVNDHETADKLSKRCGMETVYVGSGGSNSGRSYQNNSPSFQTTSTFSSGSNNGWQEQKRELLTADELLALPQRTALAFIPGMRPVVTNLIRYYERGRPRRKSLIGSFSAALMTLVKSSIIFIVAISIAYHTTALVKEKIARIYDGQSGGIPLQPSQPQFE